MSKINNSLPRGFPNAKSLLYPVISANFSFHSLQSPFTPIPNIGALAVSFGQR